jgi:hypothetical protein
VQGAITVNTGWLASGILKRIHLTMQHGTTLLNPSVMSPADNFTAVNNDRSNWDTALLQTLLRFIKRGF